MKQDLQANIWKFYLFNIFSCFVLYYGIDKIFMQARGLSVTDIVLVEIVFVVCVVVLEVPSGAIADRHSRKYILALNVALFALSTLIWIFAHGVGVFVLGVVVASIHSALCSGTDTSFLYDTLKELGREDEYARIYGKAIFWGNLIAILADIIGGMTADYLGLVVPFWITLPFSGIAVLVALSFTEPDIHRTTGEMNYFRHIADTVRLLLGNRSVVHLIVLSALLGATLRCMDEFGQLYYVKIGVPVFALGYLVAVGNGTIALGGRFAHHLNRFRRTHVFAVAILISAAGFLLVAATRSYAGVVFSFLPWLAYYFIYPLILSDFHRELPSGQRATGESFMNLCGKGMFVPIGFGFGYLADHGSLFVAYAAVGSLVACSFAVFSMPSLVRQEKPG